MSAFRQRVKARNVVEGKYRPDAFSSFCTNKMGYNVVFTTVRKVLPYASFAGVENLL